MSLFRQRTLPSHFRLGPKSSIFLRLPITDKIRKQLTTPIKYCCQARFLFPLFWFEFTIALHNSLICTKYKYNLHQIQPHRVNTCVPIISSVIPSWHVRSYKPRKLYQLALFRAIVTCFQYFQVRPNWEYNFNQPNRKSLAFECNFEMLSPFWNTFFRYIMLLRPIVKIYVKMFLNESQKRLQNSGTSELPWFFTIVRVK